MATRPTIQNGSRGPEVALAQDCLAVESDGVFGPGTEQATRDYQVTKGLHADGVIGPATWEKLDEDFSLAPWPMPLPPSFDQETINGIVQVAASSKIFTYSWKDRGRAPAGYIKGMALAFASAWQKWQNGDSSMIELARANTGNGDRDALAWYAAQFAGLGLDNSRDGIDTLRHLYALLLGLGMRESSGKHCEGRDQSASNTTSDTCEAGCFQTSYNAHTCSTAFDALFEQYRANVLHDMPQCYLATWREGVSCGASSWENYGSGKGMEFQQISKSCPVFAAEAAAVTLRNLRNHYGPINRREVELRAEAEDLFDDVQGYLEEVMPEPAPPEPEPEPEPPIVPIVTVMIEPAGSARVVVKGGAT